MVVTLSTEHITDWETFHAECARVFGFPQFYGRNMNAWIDCLSYLHDMTACAEWCWRRMITSSRSECGTLSSSAPGCQISVTHY